MGGKRVVCTPTAGIGATGGGFESGARNVAADHRLSTSWPRLCGLIVVRGWFENARAVPMPPAFVRPAAGLSVALGPGRAGAGNEQSGGGTAG